MRPHERRQAGAYPYYRLAVVDERTFCLRQLPGTFATKEEAIARAKHSGRGTYAVSVVNEDGTRYETERFDV